MERHLGIELLGDYNVTMTLKDYSSVIQSHMNDFGMKSINYLSFMVADGADADWTNENLWKEVKRFTNPTPASLNNVSFSFDVSKYVTPASGKFVSFKMLYNYVRASDGATNNWLHSPFKINNWYNLNLIPPNTLSNGGWWKCTTFVYLKAPSKPTNLTLTSKTGNLSDDISISFNGSTTNGTYTPTRYRLSIVALDENDNEIYNKVLTEKITTTSFDYNIRNLSDNGKALKDYPLVKVRAIIRALDAYEWAYSDAVYSDYITLQNNTHNVSIKKTDGNWNSIGVNNIKRIDSSFINGMKTKILDDGSEWARIFWHDVSTTATYFANSTEAGNCNLSNRFSKLSLIDNYKYNGKYELMLCYPKYSTAKYNRWIQTANPLYTTADASQTVATMGYQKVHIDFPTNWYYGMGLSTSSQAYMDCEAGHGNWYGGLGLYSAYNEGFPAPTESGMSNIQKEVELWIRIDRNVKLIDKNNTIYINTASEFYDFCDSVSNGNTYKGKTIMLMTNVTTSGASEHKDFYTAGDNDKPFEGTFDGNGHTLSILYVDNLFNQEYIGFIGHNKGVIKNLCVSSLYMNSARYGGLICGKNSGLIENCAAFGSMAWTHDTTLNITNGGITGFNSGTIRKCLVNGQINAPSQEGSSGEAGGIAGENEGDIISCRVAGMVSGYEAGGIVAYNYSIGSNIIRCINNATISSDSGYCGGIVGYAYRGTLRNCLNTGNGAVCGIIGLCENAWADNCYYASDYNSAGISFSGSGKTDTTIKKTLSSMKSQTMADLLGTNFFFYDRSSSQQFIKFGWEKVSGWSNGDGSGTDIFYYVDWAAPATKIQIVTYEDWESIGEQPTKFEFYFNNKLYTTILNPPRNINIDLYGSFDTSTSAPIETKWYGISGLKLNRENTLSYGVACFEKGTKVLTSNGLIPIENINEGDCVLSKNEQGFIEEQKVYHTYNHNPRSSL